MCIYAYQSIPKKNEVKIYRQIDRLTMYDIKYGHTISERNKPHVPSHM